MEATCFLSMAGQEQRSRCGPWSILLSSLPCLDSKFLWIIVEFHLCVSFWVLNKGKGKVLISWKFPSTIPQFTSLSPIFLLSKNWAKPFLHECWNLDIIVSLDEYQLEFLTCVLLQFFTKNNFSFNSRLIRLLVNKIFLLWECLGETRLIDQQKWKSESLCFACIFWYTVV